MVAVHFRVVEPTGSMMLKGWLAGVAPPEVPLKENEVGESKIDGAGRGVTVKVVPPKAQEVAPLVYDQPLPAIREVPAEIPVKVLPATLATEWLLLEKLPPLKPAGAEAVEV